jgi:hypothetical protein
MSSLQYRRTATTMHRVTGRPAGEMIAFFIEAHTSAVLATSRPQRDRALDLSFFRPISVCFIEPYRNAGTIRSISPIESNRGRVYNSSLTSSGMKYATS